MKRLIVAAILLLAACSTDPSSFRYHPIADGARVMKFPTPGDVTLVVRREPGFSGGGSNVFVTLDGERLAELYQGEAFEVKIQPGRYILGTAASGLGIGYETSSQLAAIAGKTYYYRIYSSFGGQMQMVPMPS